MSTVQISDTLYQQLNHAAGRRNSTVNELAQMAITIYLSGLLSPQGMYETEREQTKKRRRNLLALADAARQEYLANGGELLDEEGIMQELSERRGGGYRMEFQEC